MSDTPNQIGTLKHGLKIGSTVHKEFEVRPAKSEDMFAAEDEVGSDKPIQFSAALLAHGGGVASVTGAALEHGRVVSMKVRVA